MAVSFSRPDPSSPSAVAGASFPTTRRGFDQSEVRDFLRMVSAELSRLQERERFLEREIADQQGVVSLVPADLDEERIAELLGEETARIIQAAREAAAKLRNRAEETAQRLIRDATDDATRIREEAELEGARLRQDAVADAENEILMAKQQGRDMVDEARAYRERVLADIARRRELAREQIEDLYHGRERLIQAFERARIAADDVLGDLEDAADERSEFVNLANSTGPVPLVVQDDAPVVTLQVATPFYDQDRDVESVDPRVMRHPSMDSMDSVVDVIEDDHIADDDVAEVLVIDEPVVEDLVIDEPVAVEASPVPVAVSNVVQLFGQSEAPEPEPQPEIVTEPAPRATEGLTLRSLVAGARFIVGERVVFGALLLDLLAVLFGGATALLPMYADEILHIGQKGFAFGVLKASPYVGALIMAAFLASRPPIRRAGEQLSSARLSAARRDGAAGWRGGMARR